MWEGGAGSFEKAGMVEGGNREGKSRLLLCAVGPWFCSQLCGWRWRCSSHPPTLVRLLAHLLLHPTNLLVLSPKDLAALLLVMWLQAVGRAQRQVHVSDQHQRRKLGGGVVPGRVVLCRVEPG